MKKLRAKSITAVLMITALLWTMPAAGVYAAGSGSAAGQIAVAVSALGGGQSGAAAGNGETAVSASGSGSAAGQIAAAVSALGGGQSGAAAGNGETAVSASGRQTAAAVSGRGAAAAGAGARQQRGAAAAGAGARQQRGAAAAAGTAEPGQVVVMYEKGAVTSEAPKTIREKRAVSRAKNYHKAKAFGVSSSSGGSAALQAAENTLGQQAEIISDAVGSDFKIEDTVVLGSDTASASAKADADDSVISVVSSETKSTDELIASLEADSRIKSAEPNYIFTASAMPSWNDTYLKEMWHLTGEGSINADSMWDSQQFKSLASGSSEPVVVAVLDTGIDYTSPDLAKRMWTKPSSGAFSKFRGRYGFDFVYNTSDPMDGNGHGTHCAGIIAAQANNGAGITGVAGNSSAVKLMAVRVLDEDGAGSLDGIIAGYQYIIAMKKAGANIRAINCSLGAAVTSDIFDEVIDEAGKAGILTIAAAGNEAANNDVTPSAPANSKSDYVVSVAATDNNYSIASYSNYGKKSVDIAAPGSNILSTVSYDNYAPYLYDTEALKENTDYYGEFGGAAVTSVVNAQGETVDAVTPVPGTDYRGGAVSGVNNFGQSVMLTNRVSGSKGSASLEISDEAPLGIGNNTKNLRWKITEASAGDTYILYFPYEKNAGDSSDVFMNLAFRQYTDSSYGGRGTLDFGDVRINGIDKNGKADWGTAYSDDYSYVQMNVDPVWNSIWQASGSTSVFYPYSKIKGLRAGAGASAASVNASSESESDRAGAGASAASVNASSESESDTAGAGASAASTGSEAAEAAEADIDDEESEQVYSVKTVNGQAILVPEERSASRESVNQTVSSGDYGLGFVYQASSDGDIYVDISSIALSKPGADTSTFGRYDVYSGTSMATPVVTGAAAVITAMNPDMSAADIRSTLLSATNGYCSSWVSTGGMLDLSRYASKSSNSKPSIGSYTADFDKGTVTLRGRGFGTSPEVCITNNISGEYPEFLPESDIKVNSAGTRLVISNAGAKTDPGDEVHHGIIGSDITFDIMNNNGQFGQATYYVVNGLDKYTKEYEFSSSSDIWDESGSAGSSTSKVTSQSEDTDEDEDVTLPSGLEFVTGANDLVLYDSTGSIYRIEWDYSIKSYNYSIVGTDPAEAVNEYVKGILTDSSREDSLWRPASRAQEKSLDYYSLEMISAPAYMGGSVYELLKADLGYRQSVLLVGMKLDGSSPWRIYYDSLEDLGSAPSSLKWTETGETTLAGYKGRLYIFGTMRNEEYYRDETSEASETASQETENTADEGVYEYTEADIQTAVFSCAPDRIGIKWKKEAASIPAPRARGVAVNQGGNLYYVLSTSSYDSIDYTVYKFNGKKWSVGGTLPQALYTGEKSAQVIDLGFFQIKLDGYAGIPCAVGADNKGIIFGGMSFDGAGDTFRFNTKTGKIQPLRYTLWGETADRATYGTVAGRKLYVQYSNDSQQKIIGKSVNVSNAYVKLTDTVSGKGSGIVSGGGYYTKGEKSVITISPDDGCYIYSVASSGTSRNFTLKSVKGKKAASTVKARSKAVTLTYPAAKNGTLDVVFGRISTKIRGKSSLNRAVGTRKLGIRTNGTVSGVKLKSSNPIYARVNSNGTVTFKKAGIGKTVKITATAQDNPKLKKTVTVTIRK